MPFDTTTPLQAQQVSDDLWILTANLRYQAQHEEVVVEPGFKTDFASVPFFLTWLVPKSGRYTRAAVVHDFLCRKQGFPRNDADGVFRRAMGELGVPTIRRYVMWGTVRIASGFKSASWNDVLGIVLLAIAFLGGVMLTVSPLVWAVRQAGFWATAFGPFLIALAILWILAWLYVAEAVTWVVLRAFRKTPRAGPHFWWN